jgi:hypothetical protein
LSFAIGSAPQLQRYTIFAVVSGIAQALVIVLTVMVLRLAIPRDSMAGVPALARSR